MLEIQVLGGRRVRHGARARAPSARSLELLAHLVLHAGSPQPRILLAGLLWPGSSEAQARTNLRRELHHLRTLLADDPSLRIDATALTWVDGPTCRVDLGTFLRERAAATGDDAAIVRHGDAALALYGDLLPGVYDGWVLEARDQLRRACVELCGLVGDAHRRAGRAREAQAAARLRIRLEPLEEAGYHALMRAQAEAGDVGAAVATYHRCADVLDAELGIAPGAATTALADALLGAAGRSRRPTARLVGRDAECAELEARWQRARAGEPGLVLLTGEAGVGKSRLAAELAAVVRARGDLVATAQCFGPTAAPPLAPVADWLHTPGLREAALEPRWQAETARLLPGAAADSGVRALADHWQRHRFLEGLCRAVLAAGRPTLLVLDDAHRCDGETAAWLVRLLGGAGRAPLLVVATARDGPPPLLREAGTELAIGPLDERGTLRLAASVLGREPDPAERDLLVAASAGYPLFVVEAARALPGGPADLDGMLRHRLDSLPGPAREVAGLAAALGRDIGLDVLAEASDLPAPALVGAVDQLWRQRILREHDGGYDFTHDALRAAAYAAVGPPGRWLLHRRLAQALELRYAGRSDEVAVPLAEQCVLAGLPDRALHHLGRAAEVAAGRFAHTEAVRHHRRRLEILAARAPSPDRDARELAVLQALSAPLNAAQGYASEELRAVLERSCELAGRLDRPAERLRALVGLFAVRFVQGDNTEAHRIARETLALAGVDPSVAGQAHFAYAGSALSLGLPGRAIEHFELAVSTANGEVSLQVGSRPDVHAQAWAAHAHWLLGREADALARAADAVARGRESAHPYSLAIALAYAAVLAQLRGDRAALLPLVDELAASCRRHGFAYYAEWALILDGWAAGAAGVPRIEEGLARLRRQGARARLPYWLSLLAEARLAAGDPDGARATLDAARVAAERQADRWWLPEVLRRRAELSDPASARALLARALDLAVRQRSRVLEQRVLAANAARTLPT